MNKLILITMIICIAFSIKQRSESHIRAYHFIDGQLCLKRGGKICGNFDKDCCVKGCQYQNLGMKEVCQDGIMLDLSNAPDCKQLCAKSNGTLFKNDLLDDQHCCKSTALAGNKCPTDAKIDISACGKDTLAGKLVGFINHHLSV